MVVVQWVWEDLQLSLLAAKIRKYRRRGGVSHLHNGPQNHTCESRKILIMS